MTRRNILARGAALAGYAAAFGALAASCAPAAYAFNQYTLYNFTGKADGAGPVGGVVQDAAGNYYGTTYQGGAYTCPNPPYGNQGCGTIYRLAADGTFTLLASFTGINGAHGNSTPVLIGNTLYGTTALGGTANAGTIFAINTDGTGFAILHGFTGADGSDPKALAIGPNNTLYGVAENGGAYANGTLFSLTRTGTFADLQDFSQPTTGRTPVTIVSAAGTLVGSTYYGGATSAGCLYGCGTIFTYTPATRTFKTPFYFPSDGSEGDNPYVGSVGPGPTVYGGNYLSLFSLSAATGYKNLLTLSSYGLGNLASGPLYTPGGILYGTLGGTVSLVDGLAYSLYKGTYTLQGEFSGSGAPRSGSTPDAQPILNHDGNLVGTTAASGLCSTCGAIWLSIPGPAQ